MGCCGSKRMMLGAALQGAGPPIPAPMGGAASMGSAPTRRMVFIYRGSVPLVVTGRVSGRRYVFPQAGARVAVDARDAPLLERLPLLARDAYGT